MLSINSISELICLRKFFQMTLNLQENDRLSWKREAGTCASAQNFPDPTLFVFEGTCLSADLPCGTSYSHAHDNNNIKI